MNISYLRSNLVEIYSTLDQGKQIEEHLIGSLWGHRIYNVHAGWGKIWRVVYLFVGKKNRDKKLNRAFIKTQQIFEENLKIIEESSAHFSYYVAQKSRGGAINDYAYLKCRRALTRWFDATYPFLKRVHRKDPSLQAFFQKQLNLSVEDSPAVFMCEKLFEQSVQLQRLIDLEGQFYGPLPYKILRKLALAQQLSDAESKEMSNFVKFLNKNKKDITVHFFHRFLKSLVASFDNEGSTKPSLDNLEGSLVEYECKVFKKKDQKLLAWRSQLKPGDSIRVNGKEIILGERIGEKPCGFDQNIHFAIQGDPQKIVTIPVNEAILAIRKRLSEEQGYVLKMPHIFEIDKSGSCAIVEKLTTPLSLKWLSKNDQFHKEDEDHVGPLTTTVSWMLKEQISPARLSPYYLMFNAEGELKTLKLILKTKHFDFNNLQAFVLLCSAGNLRVFKHVNEMSCLWKHEYATFYEKILENALKDSFISVEAYANQASIVDSTVVARAKQLVEEAKSLQIKCFEQLKPKLKKKPFKLLSAISKKIIEQYRLTSAAGILWQDLDVLVQETILKQEERKRSLLSPSPSRYLPTSRQS